MKANESTRSEIEEEFVQWLYDKRDVHPQTARGYISAVRQWKQFLDERSTALRPRKPS